MNKAKTTFDKPTKWNPMGSMLLLVPTVEPERTDGGIILPDTVRRKATSGFIVKMGDSVGPAFKLGDEVFFEQHQEYRVKLDDNEEEAILIDSYKVLLHLPKPLDRETSHGGGTSLAIPPPGFVQQPMTQMPTHDANGVRVQ